MYNNFFSLYLLKFAAHNAFFLLDCLRSNKLLKILRSVRCNSNDLLDRKRSSRKKASCAAGLILFKIVNVYEIMYPICVIWIT